MHGAGQIRPGEGYSRPDTGGAAREGHWHRLWRWAKTDRAHACSALHSKHSWQGQAGSAQLPIGSSWLRLSSCSPATHLPPQSGVENWPAQILACGSPPGSAMCLNTNYDPSVDLLQPGELHCHRLWGHTSWTMEGWMDELGPGLVIAPATALLRAHAVQMRVAASSAVSRTGGGVWLLRAHPACMPPGVMQ